MDGKIERGQYKQTSSHERTRLSEFGVIQTLSERVSFPVQAWSAAVLPLNVEDIVAVRCNVSMNKEESVAAVEEMG